MNSKKCKQLRKIHFGDTAHRQETYLINDKGQIIIDPKSPKAKYKAAKRVYKKTRRLNKDGGK